MLAGYDGDVRVWLRTLRRRASLGKAVGRLQPLRGSRVVVILDLGGRPAISGLHDFEAGDMTSVYN